ncbi:hypothetical protein [Phormidium sp. CCY1219]|uniref:hypothetical protein n=1 Tax=Phormidium sp. CCY1219 TaxID=2886104 RepID=UPI002D1F8803|nr:hypothetical protein [Phormidium sp. CCY1219]MEB3831220.1 hypothetical protein [Phormidium sp. CCY1219]
MNPEETPTPDEREQETSEKRQPEVQPNSGDSETTEELNAIAKAMMVNLLWNKMGLFDEKQE